MGKNLLFLFSFLIFISGGAVSAEASYLNVTNSLFYANVASGTGFGGAIYVSDTYVSSFTSVFDNNSGLSLLALSLSFLLLFSTSPSLSSIINILLTSLQLTRGVQFTL